MRGRETLETRLIYSRRGFWSSYALDGRLCQLVIRFSPPEIHPGRNQASYFHEFQFSLLMIATSPIRFCGMTGIYYVFRFPCESCLVPAYRHATGYEVLWISSPTPSKNGRARSWGREAAPRISRGLNFSRGFLSHLARRTKRKMDYS